VCQSRAITQVVAPRGTPGSFPTYPHLITIICRWKKMHSFIYSHRRAFPAQSMAVADHIGMPFDYAVRHFSTVLVQTTHFLNIISKLFCLLHFCECLLSRIRIPCELDFSPCVSNPRFVPILCTKYEFKKSATLYPTALYVGFEVLIAEIMNVAIFWDVEPCGPYMNRRFGGTHHLHIQGRKSAEQETSVI
jgi:hypothetical protein